MKKLFSYSITVLAILIAGYAIYTISNRKVVTMYKNGKTLYLVDTNKDDSVDDVQISSRHQWNAIDSFRKPTPDEQEYFQRYKNEE
jgi:hypothetical protein